jgi:hypothetical protein
MYSTNSAALTLATAASSLAAAQASTDIGRSLWTLGCGRRMSPRLGILRASEIDDLSVRPHDSDPGPRAVPPTLEDSLAGGSSYVLPVRRLADNGLDAWAQVLGLGSEGYVAKDRLSPYRDLRLHHGLAYSLRDPSLTWSRVDFKAGVIRLDAGTTKSVAGAAGAPHLQLSEINGRGDWI